MKKELLTYYFKLRAGRDIYNASRKVATLMRKFYTASRFYYKDLLIAVYVENYYTIFCPEWYEPKALSEFTPALKVKTVFPSSIFEEKGQLLTFFRITDWMSNCDYIKQEPKFDFVKFRLENALQEMFVHEVVKNIGWAVREEPSKIPVRIVDAYHIAVGKGSRIAIFTVHGYAPHSVELIIHESISPTQMKSIACQFGISIIDVPTYARKIACKETAQAPA